MTQINSKRFYKILITICAMIIALQFALLYAIYGSMVKIKANIGNLSAIKTAVTYRNIEIQTIGCKLPDDLKLASSTMQFSAKEVFGGRRTLVYYFSQLQCKMCIESQIEVIKAVFGNDSTNIVMLANALNIRDLFVFRNTHKLNCPIYKIEEPLNLPPDTLMIPYFMIIDEDLNIVNTFITMKERMDYSLKYLKSMYRYFHSDKDETNNLDIAIDKKHIDLGNVKNSSSKTVRFTISNNSTQNVQLDVIPDCDCTTIDFGNGILQAQEKKQITATIKFDEEGEFVKYIYVYYNNNQNPTEVEIRGCVK